MVESFETRSLVGFLSILHHLIVRNCETATDNDWLLLARLDDIKTNFGYFFAPSLAQMSWAKKYCDMVSRDTPRIRPQPCTILPCCLGFEGKFSYHVIPLRRVGLQEKESGFLPLCCHCRHLPETHKNKGRLATRATLLMNTAQALSSDKMTFA